MVTKPAEQVTGHRSLSPLLWNWTWPPSGTPSYKADSDSTILPLTRSSRVLCALSHSTPLSPFLSISVFLSTHLSSSFTQPHYTMPDASKPIQKGGAPSHLVALPSVFNSLSSLPEAKNLAHVSVYTSSTSVQHAAESQAKLQKALLKNAGSPHSVAYANVPTSTTTQNQQSQQLMMKTPTRPKLHV